MLSYILTFLGGLLAGAMGQYMADRWTDRRRRKEIVKEEKGRFTQVVEKLPQLIAEIKADLERLEDQFIREFFVASKQWTVNSPEKRFIYCLEDHDDLHGKVKILENHGYVSLVKQGTSPIYRMTEEFVELVRSS